MTALTRSGSRPQSNEAGETANLASWPVFICLLGGFQVLKAGHPLVLRNADKTRLLLSSLALQDHFRLSREILMQTLWPNAQAALAGHSLNSLVYNLRRLLGDAIGGAMPVLYADGYYHLNVEAGIGIDIAWFDTLVQEGHRHEWAGQQGAMVYVYEQAIHLYRGDLCSVPDSQSLVMCEALRAQYLTLLAKLADHYFDEHDYTNCLSYAWRLLSEDPCREDAHRLMMRCYIRQGQRAQALHQYRLCESILRTEFDAEPEPVTRELYQQIRLHPNSV